jgi:pyrimidine operon attenuation protein/uracil phosphoribosyltransferase
VQEDVANDAPPSSASGRSNAPEVQQSRSEESRSDKSRSDKSLSEESPSGSSGASSRPPSGASERVVLDDTQIRRALVRIGHEVIESVGDPTALYLVAIPNGGVPLARILVENIAASGGFEAPLGILDTTLYRDDLAIRGTRPRLRRTEMPSSVDDHVVVLIEDVVNTGRTIRAAMDALMDFGRPSAVKVVALVDRGHRELPIKIDFVGKNIPTRPGETVVFRAEEDGSGLLEAVVEGMPDAPDGSGTAGGRG